MPYKLRVFLLTALLIALPLMGYSAGLSKDFQILENKFQQGDIAGISSLLPTAKTNNDEDRALQLYLSAMLKKTENETISSLQQAANLYPKTFYGQMSILELAKYHILKREINQAEELLHKITNVQLIEKFYWLAYCADSKSNYDKAISYSENYLRMTSDNKYLENTYYIIANAYRKQGKYQSAITTLEKLKKIEGYPKNEQYFFYQLGYCYQLLGNVADAYQNYKKAFELNHNSPLAFMAEDKLFELRNRYNPSLDLSFLYPYTTLDIPGLIQPEITIPPAASIIQDLPLKLENRPETGYYVQIGCFSSEANARKRTEEIRGLNISAIYFEDKNKKNTPWVVASGPYSSITEAETLKSILAQKSVDSFITRY